MASSKTTVTASILAAVVVACVLMTKQSSRSLGVSAVLEELRASRSVPFLEDLCPARLPGERGLDVWTRLLSESLLRAEDAPSSAGTDAEAELARSPLEVWRDRDWSLEDAAWKAEAEALERRVADLAGVVAVFRTVADYEPLDCGALAASGADYPDVPYGDLFDGCRAAALELVQAARHGDADLVARDLEALFALAERLHEPVNLVLFHVWGSCLHQALLALEASLPLLGERLDRAALDARLAVLAPHGLALAALERERAFLLRRFAAPALSAEAGFPVNLWPFRPDTGRELENILLGYAAALDYLGRETPGAGDRPARLDELEQGAARMVLELVVRTDAFTRGTEARLALARLALRVRVDPAARDGIVAAAPDPCDSARALRSVALPPDRLRLESVGPDGIAATEDDVRWTLFP